MKYFFSFVGLLLVALAIVVSLPSKETITINGHDLRVTIADSPREMERGLSGRKTLDKNQGMLFVFPEPTIPEFWMKDMYFAIDIIWLDENKHIIAIEHNVAPETYPAVFRPPIPIRYVLEVNAGAFPL